MTLDLIRMYVAVFCFGAMAGFAMLLHGRQKIKPRSVVTSLLVPGLSALAFVALVFRDPLLRPGHTIGTAIIVGLMDVKARELLWRMWAEGMLSKVLEAVLSKSDKDGDDE
jgi:hypothetical protein